MRLRLEPTRTYATAANAVKAVEKANIGEEYRYIIYYDEDLNRYWPVFIGEKCLQAGIHFRFHVLV